MTYRILDTRGQVCPYPDLETRRALRELSPAEGLEVLIDFYPAKQTIPRYCEEQGFSSQVLEAGPGQWRILITKKTTQTAA